MPSSWYMTLVAQDPNNRHAIKRIHPKIIWVACIIKRKNGTWIVVDYSAGLHVMNLHNEAKAFDLTIKDVFVAEEQNHNAGYLFIRKKRFKLSILESNNQLLFFWEEFGSDSLYIEKKAQGVGRFAFYCMLKKYGLDSNTCLRSILGLCEPQIIIKLKQLVHEKFPLQYPTIFQQESSESSRQANAKKKEETLYRSLKRDQEKIDDFLCENTSQDVLFGIQVEPNGKTLSPKPAQALILKSMEYKQTIYSQNKTIKTLKERIISLNGETENEKTDITALNNLEI
ncbi:hypothetical protein RhiirA4_479987 [Rhizophagus irregularis]|uniref:Uncharacterized protein n=1 Tax=Rhizophagus irregularis TaxID=588596 RepID=A0A2I1HH91_9GLOM|nr:hypothetical protein RhiirA4_479987 [Rhizophagus irregularis]